ncbi:MAG: DUF2652 domain-containing protein [Chloroflexota bacterium]
MPEQGFLVISDITGYSTYLHESELEHAQSSLTDLLTLLIEHARSPLVISKLEGDAVFSYSPRDGFLSGQTMLEMIETTYAAFRKALDLMVINTTCTCNACRNLPNLDLKFFIHYGEYSIQKLGDFQELVGHDVNLVHRMMKNSITEDTGLKAYAAYSQAVIDALDMSELMNDTSRHKEMLADIGEVQLYIQDMHGVWEQRKDDLRISIDPKDAKHAIEFDFPISPQRLWEYLTKPEYRNIFFSSDNQNVSGKKGGRIGPDAVYVCAHGESESFHTILDWQPFKCYTTREVTGSPIKLTFVVTYLLSPTEEGSRLQLLPGHPTGPKIRALIFRYLIEPLFTYGIVPNFWDKGAKALLEIIEQDLADSEFAKPPKIIFGNEMVKNAAVESLQDNAISGD